MVRTPIYFANGPFTFELAIVITSAKKVMLLLPLVSICLFGLPSYWIRVQDFRNFD